MSYAKSVTMQGKISLSSADLASRLAFLREKQGITLEKLADGRPSTAQSWMDGKQPRRDKWDGIADRLGLSEVLVFFGRPESEADYAFIEKWRNEIEESESLLSSYRWNGEDMTTEELEPPASARTVRAVIKACENHLKAFIETTEGSTDKLSWLLVELRDRFPLNKWTPKEKSPPRTEAEEAAFRAEVEHYRRTLPRPILPPISGEAPDEETPERAAQGE